MIKSKNYRLLNKFNFAFIIYCHLLVWTLLLNKMLQIKDRILAKTN
jgi:hypothetical protein